MDLTTFAEEVGDESAGAVTIAGSSTRGGAVQGLRSVAAPSGIVDIQADEMTMTCGAGTAVADVLAALAEQGQTVAVPPSGTIGGALASADSVVSRLGHGPVRDTLLRARYISAAGRIVTAGGTTVKNVSGFDVCRLLVGAHGTLGFLGEVILRTRPLPKAAQWFVTDEAPMAVFRRLYRPAAVLWDGMTTWSLVEGHPSDVAAQGSGMTAVEVGPELPVGSRWSVPIAHASAPAWLPPAPHRFISAIGVGTVFTDAPARQRSQPSDLAAVHDRVKAEFDPTGRLNPGRTPA